MKNLLLTILGMILLIPNLCKAQADEVIWRTGIIGIINDVEITKDKHLFYTPFDGNIQVRSVENGKLIDSINFESYFDYINSISITDDDKYLAISGDSPYLLIWDLENNREYKRFTTEIVDRDESHSVGSWVSVSISGDGTKISGIAKSSSDYFTKLIVFNVQSGDTLLSQVRNLRGQTPFDPSFEWVSTEFSPNGEYLVAQLDMTRKNNGVADDSLYIYKTNPFVIDNVINNSLTDTGYPTRQFSFSSYENLLATSISNQLLIYNFGSKEVRIKYFESYVHHILFSNELQKMYISIGSSKSIIYNYRNEIIDFEVSIPFFAFLNADDKKILGGSLYEFALFNAPWQGNTGVEQSKTDFKIIYPNPSDSNLNINFNSKYGGNFKYQIFDLNSNLILKKELGFFEKGNNSVTISIHSLSAQIYLLKISSNKESYTYKIIKE